ncbi:MAG: DUF4926 domain-containing protein [Anaerolineae bacterium]|nr:DUF4926 domain-containing protein [Anaerolineae bacterium]
MKELDQVVLLVDLPDFHLKVVDVGTIVDVTPNGRQFTLEFFNYSGDTLAVVPVAPSQVRPLRDQEVMSAHVLERD